MAGAPFQMKRAGLAERATYIVFFLLLFQLGGAALNSLNLFTNPGGVGTGSSAYISSITSSIGCSTVTLSTIAQTCKNDVGGGLASVLPNVLIFGNWVQALQTIGTFAWALVNPFGFLAAFGLPAVIIAVFSGGLDALWLFLIVWVMSGRPL